LNQIIKVIFVKYTFLNKMITKQKMTPSFKHVININPMILNSYNKKPNEKMEERVPERWSGKESIAKIKSDFLIISCSWAGLIFFGKMDAFFFEKDAYREEQRSFSIASPQQKRKWG